MIENTGLTSDMEIIAILTATGAVVKKYGPTVLKVLSKLLISSTVVDRVKEQGAETALAKLQTPDDLFCILENIELDKNGNVVLKDEGKVSRLLHENRALTTFEKDEIIRVMRQIFQVKGDEKV